MPLIYENRRRQITLNVTPYIYDVDAVALSLINQFRADGADPEVTRLDEYKLSLTFRESDELTYEVACQKVLWNQYVQNIEQKNITNNIELLKRMVDPYFDSPVVANVNEVVGDGKGQLDGISPSAFSDGEVLWANGKPIKQPSYTIGDEEVREPAGGPLPLSRDLNEDVQPSTITAFKKRYLSKINRSSWKTAHNDDHPHVNDMDDLQSHLISHHQGDFIGDVDDHEWFHTDPKDYIDTHRGVLFPIEPHDPDHYHTNKFERLNLPDSLPPSFAGFKKLSDPTSNLRGEGASAFTEPSYQDDQPDSEQVVGPQDLDSNAINVDKFPKSVGVFKNSSWNKRFADSAGGGQFGTPIDYNENRLQSVESPGLGVSYPLDTGQRNYSEQYQDANPLSLRSWFTGQDLNGPWPHTKNTSGPLDFEPRDDTTDSTSMVGVTSSWHQSFVETLDTHPEEPSPDSLLNPSDELKNGRPRSTDLPTQVTQFVPGMLTEHDQMGGSGFSGGSA